MDYKYLILDKNAETGIARLIFNRPEKLNAFDQEMQDEFVKALRQVEKDRR